MGKRFTNNTQFSSQKYKYILCDILQDGAETRLEDDNDDDDYDDGFSLDMSSIDDSTVVSSDISHARGFGANDIELTSSHGGSSIGSSNSSHKAPQGREMKIDIEFKNLSVVLANKMRILNDVSGSLESGKMTAIMGPSGCGKSTLISALTNRIKDGGKVEGDVYINGEPKPLL